MRPKRSISAARVPGLKSSTGKKRVYDLQQALVMTAEKAGLYMKDYKGLKSTLFTPNGLTR